MPNNHQLKKIAMSSTNPATTKNNAHQTKSYISAST